MNNLKDCSISYKGADGLHQIKVGDLTNDQALKRNVHEIPGKYLTHHL